MGVMGIGARRDVSRIAFRSLLALTLLWSGPLAGAQAQPVTYEHHWSQLVAAEAGSANVISVATDGAGNVYAGGEFAGSLAIVGAAQASHGARDMFLAKFTSAGVPLWARTFGGAGNDDLLAIAVDVAGNAYVTGAYAGTLIGAGGALPSGGVQDAFLIAYNPSGDLRWAKRMGGAQPDQGRGLAAVEDGGVVWATIFQGTADLDGRLLTSAGGYDMAFTRLGANGNLVWHRRAGGANADAVNALAVNHDMVVAAGRFEGSTTLDGETRVAVAGQDMLVAGLRLQDGAVQWVRSAGGSGSEEATHVAVDPFGNLIVAGTFGLSGGAVNFGGGPVSPTGGSDVFVAKYTANGAYVWAKGHGGSTPETLGGLAVDANGTLAITGSFQVETDLGGSNLPSAGRFDVFMAAYSSSGQHLWSDAFGDLVTEKGQGLASDGAGNFFAGGFTNWRVDFGGGPLINEGDPDGYLVKFSLDEGPPPSGFVDVSGRIEYADGNRAVPGVAIEFTAGASTFSTVSDANGNYVLADLPAGRSWQIRLSKQADPRDALSALDASRMLQAATGQIELSSLQALAAEVTGNGELSALDASGLLQLITGSRTRLPLAEACGSDWIFVRTTTDPSAFRGVPNSCAETILQGVRIDTSAQIDFNAVLLGDVTGNWQ